jgi:hypothetical protein
MEGLYFNFVEVQEYHGLYKLFLRIEPWSYLGRCTDKMQALMAANCVEVALTSFVFKEDIL